jgi:3-phosphoshikimate 1-carboxyvinyltransferase
MTASSSTSREARAVAAGRAARGRVEVPGSKSATHRQLALTLLAGQAMEVRRPLLAEDTELFLVALRELGWGVRVEDAGASVHLAPPGVPVRAATLQCGNAGTLFRFLVGVLAVVPGEWTLDGSPRLRERPVGPLAGALAELGARVTWLAAPGHPPLTVHGGSLRGGEATVDAGESSQYLSALLLAGLAAPAPLALHVRALTSAPYVDVTVALARAWGGRIERDGSTWRVWPGLRAPATVTVEGDWSAAAYPAAAAVISGGEVAIGALDRGSAQGDRRFLELLREMGARVVWRGDDLVVAAGAPLRALDADLGDIPDQVPTLAAVAPFARGTTRITGVPHLRIKESDRLAAMAAELGRLGVPVVERPDGLEIEGVWADAAPPADLVEVATYGDHRIAMSLALVGLRRPGVRVAAPEVVRKSYPGFWDDLERLVRR